MTTADSQPNLRLVGVDEWTSPRARDQDAIEEAVAAENRSAALNPALDHRDPRWVLATRAYAQLQGTALSFDRRQRVMRTAKNLGVRSFDANVIIAIVQDHARRGENLSGAAGTIRLLETPTGSRKAPRMWTRWVSAVLCAATATTFLIWWLTGV